MTPRKRVAAKLAAGFLLVLLAMGVSFVIKDSLAARNPEAALPEMQITYNGTPVPAEFIMMDSYSWRFLFSPVSNTTAQPGDWKSLAPAWLPAGAALDLVFSYNAERVTVWMSENYSDNFVELGGVWAAPGPGDYTYRILADWGGRGSITYYMNVHVPG